MTEPRPPRLLETLLRVAVPSRDRDEIVGSMQDMYAARARRDGRRRAGAWYARHVLIFMVTVLRSARNDERAHGRGGRMRGMGAEIARGARRLRRAPVFTTVSVLTIGIGIGAFASLYGVVDTVLLEPPPYEEPEELLWVWRDYWFDLERGWLGGPDVAGLRERSEAFEGVAAFRSAARNLTGRDGNAPRRVRVTLASADLFDLLGVPPALGRGFLPGEDAPDAPAVTVLGYDLWRTHFGADADVLGSDIYLNGEATTVVGVAPPDFRFVVHASLGAPTPAADLYVPLRLDLASLNPGSGMFAGLARVREGASDAQVEAAIDAVAADIDQRFGSPGLELWGIELHEDLTAAARPALVTLLGAAGFLLLILGANLTSLLLGRATQRDRELALISALGAGRPQVLQSALAESLILGIAGGAVGIALAFLGVDLIRAVAPEQLPRRADIAVDLSVLAVTVLATMAMAACAGFLPARHGLRGGVAGRLRDAGGRGGTGRDASRARSALVVTQVALSLVLLVGSGLLTRAFVRLLLADPGFEGREALAFSVSLDASRYPDDASIAEVDRRFRLAIAGLPGVTAVGATDALPLSASASQNGAGFPGAPGNTGLEEHDAPLVDFMMVTPGYMEAAGMRLLDGRTFDEREAAEGPPVVIIDDLLADRFFPSGSAVGSPLVMGEDTATIVGVVDHARHYTVYADDRPQTYWPLARNAFPALDYVVSGTGDATAYVPEIRRLLDEIDAEAPLTDPRTLQQLIDASLGRERLSLTLLALFAGGAVLLAVLGIYGVVSNAVARRTHEIGVRMALGADRAGVLRLVFGQGMRLAAVGSGIGLLGAWASSRILVGVASGVEPYDALVYAAVVALLLAVTATAAWVPARKATRIDPSDALRSD